MYLLDTNICIYLMKKKHPGLQTKVEQEKLFKLALSSITISELEFGVAKSLYPQQNRELLYGFLSPFEIIPFSELDAENFGSIPVFSRVPTDFHGKNTSTPKPLAIWKTNRQ